MPLKSLVIEILRILKVLFWIIKDSESSVLQFPERRGGKHLSSHRTRRRKRKPNVPLVRRTKMRRFFLSF